MNEIKATEMCITSSLSQLCHNHWEHKIYVNFISYICQWERVSIAILYKYLQIGSSTIDAVSSTNFIINYMMKIESVVCKSLCMCVYVYVSIESR